MTICETQRLTLRQLTAEDAPFIMGLLNEAPFLRFIGDRGVRNLDDARRYIETGPQESYARHGFGLWLVVVRETEEPIGICGLLKREGLQDPDLGFAYTEGAWGRGYGREAARAVITFAATSPRLPRLLAITSVDNVRSIRLLEKVGFAYDGLTRLGPQAEPVRLFSLRLETASQ